MTPNGVDYLSGLILFDVFPAKFEKPPGYYLFLRAIIKKEAKTLGISCVIKLSM